MEKGVQEAINVVTSWGSSVWTEAVHVLDLAVNTFLLPLFFLYALFFQ